MSRQAVLPPPPPWLWQPPGCVAESCLATRLTVCSPSVPNSHTACEVCQKSIEKLRGKLVVKEAARAVSERDDRLLSEKMEALETQNREVSRALHRQGGDQGLAVSTLSITMQQQALHLVEGGRPICARACHCVSAHAPQCEPSKSIFLT